MRNNGISIKEQCIEKLGGKQVELVSIVVPVYNGEKYIENCVKYIKNQTYTNLEIILVNDGSTDNSRIICEAAIKDDKRFKLINKKNGGTARARNTGLENATGKYITFLDVDDEYKIEMIEKMVDLIEEYQVELVVCGYYFKIENEKNGITTTTYLEEKRYPFSVFYSFDEMRDKYISIWDSDMFSNVWNKLYSMETIRRNGMRFRDGHVYTEDRVFNRLFLSKCQSVLVTDQCLYYYVRERIGSTTEKYREDSFDIRHKEFIEFNAHFKEMGIWDEVSREYTCREFIERIAGCIENVFHGKMSFGEKYGRIKMMISDKDTREAIKYAKCRSLKMRIFVLPIRWNWTFGTYMMGLMIYLIRKSNPVIFHKLKSKR